MVVTRRSLAVSLATICAVGIGTLAVVAVTGDDSSHPVASSSAPVDSSNPFRTGRTLVIPHGGGDGLFPENTLLAFERTMAMGADVVDVDLRISADGVVVGFHDSTVDRITGSMGTVNKLTYAQLAEFDAGWAFSPAGSDTHPFRGQGVTIPTLESILQRFPTTLLSLDLKDETTAMVQPVCDLLREHKRFNDVFVGSNDDPQIVEFRKQCPDVQTSAIMADVYAERDARDSNDPNFVSAVAVNQPPFRIDNRELVDAESLAWAHDHGIATLTWVVNDPADMQRLVDLGVDGIYTSYPDRLLKILDRCKQEC
jgi:glycerophosphoryl diester phosphodiesterase